MTPIPADLYPNADPDGINALIAQFGALVREDYQHEPPLSWRYETARQTLEALGIREQVDQLLAEERDQA